MRSKIDFQGELVLRQSNTELRVACTPKQLKTKDLGGLIEFPSSEISSTLMYLKVSL